MIPNVGDEIVYRHRQFEDYKSTVASVLYGQILLLDVHVRINKNVVKPVRIRPGNHDARFWADANTWALPCEHRARYGA